MIKKIAIVIGMVLAVFLVVCLVPLKTVAYTVMVNYEDTETYYEDEPYEETETYTEAMPLDYKKEAHFGSDIPWEGEGLVPTDIPITPFVYTEVQNTDTVPGTFHIHFYFSISHVSIIAASIRFWSEGYDGNKELYLKPGETKTAKHHFYEVNLNDLKRSDDWSWGCEVTPDTKTVERERTITKYRQVEKQRTVTKQRPEPRYKKETLLDYWLHY